MKALTNSRIPIPAVATYTEFKKEAMTGPEWSYRLRAVAVQVSQR